MTTTNFDNVGNHKMTITFETMLVGKIEFYCHSSTQKHHNDNLRVGIAPQNSLKFLLCHLKIHKQLKQWKNSINSICTLHNISYKNTENILFVPQNKVSLFS